MSDISVMSKVEQLRPKIPTLQLRKAWGKQIVFLPASRKIKGSYWASETRESLKAKLTNELFDVLLGKLPSAPDTILNLLPHLMIREYTGSKYSQEQCIEMFEYSDNKEEYCPFGTWFWHDGRLLPSTAIIHDVSDVVDSTSDMFTVLSRLLAAAISEWTDYRILSPTVVPPAGIHLSRLTKVFTDPRNPCAFMLPSPTEPEGVLTGDIVTTLAFQSHQRNGEDYKSLSMQDQKWVNNELRQHIGIRFGSTQRKTHTESDLLQKYDPDLFSALDIKSGVFDDAERADGTIWFGGFGFPARAPFAISVALNHGYQIPFLSLFGHIAEDEKKTDLIAHNNSQVFAEVAQRRAERMTGLLTYMLTLIHKDDNFMQLPETLAALKQWVGAIFAHLYSSCPQKLAKYFDVGTIDVAGLFSSHIADYKMFAPRDDYRPEDTPVWDHELSDLTFWSIAIAVNSYIGVVRAVSDETTIVPDNIAELFLNARGKQYIAHALAIGTLLRSAESVGPISGINITQLMDSPSALIGRGHDDIIAWFRSNLLPDYRTLQLGMLQMHTHMQRVLSLSAEMFAELFITNASQWLFSLGKSTEPLPDVRAASDDRVMSIEFRNNTWVSRLESGTFLQMGSGENNVGTGRVLVEITLPDTMQAVQIVDSGNNAARMWQVLEAFLGHSLREMANGNRLIGTTDYYMEVLLPAGYRVKTTDMLIRKLRTVPQAERGRFFSVIKTLSATYLRMIGLSDYLNKYRRISDDLSSSYNSKYGLSVRCFAAAMWLNIGFRDDAYLKFIFKKGLEAISAEPRTYLSTVLQSLDHCYDLQPGSIYLTDTGMVRSFSASSKAVLDTKPAVTMLMIAETFHMVYRKACMEKAFIPDNNNMEMANLELNIFNEWLIYMSMLAKERDALELGVIRNFIEGYQSILRASGNTILGENDRFLLIATLLVGSLGDAFDPGNMSRQLLMAFVNMYSIVAPEAKMTSQQTVSWTLLVATILSSMDPRKEYVERMMPLFQRHIWNALRIYDIRTSNVPEPYDIDASHPIIGFSSLYDYLFTDTTKDFGEAAGNSGQLSELKTHPINAMMSLNIYSLFVNQSVMWLGGVPAAIVHQFIQSGRAWEDVESYIRSFDLLSRATDFGYVLMARYPDLVKEAIRFLGAERELTDDELGEWTEAIHRQVLSMLNKETA